MFIFESVQISYTPLTCIPTPEMTASETDRQPKKFYT